MQRINKLLTNILLSASFIGLLTSNAFSQTSEQTPPSAPQPSVTDLCKLSDTDLKAIKTEIDSYVGKKLTDEQLLIKVNDYSPGWKTTIINNPCNNSRSNPITCPESSEAMKSWRVSDSVNAMIISINYQVTRAYSRDLVKQFFDNELASHRALCANLTK